VPVRQEVDREPERAERPGGETREPKRPRRRDEQRRQPHAADEPAGAGELRGQGLGPTITVAVAWWSPTPTVRR
jgi:hypothetical protein